MGVKLGQKWAVKDGNLLASNQVGSRFFNKEFDFSRASNGTYVDRDGLLKTAELYNLFPNSEDFSTGGWVLIGTIVSNEEISPQGVQNATKINFASGGELVRTTSFTIGQQYTFSFYAKVESGTFDFTYGNIDYTLTSGTATTEWQRFEITQTAPVATRYPKINPTDTGDLLIFGAQIVEGTEPLDYQYTNGLQGLPRISFEDGVGHLLLEPQSTNIVTYSEDYSQTAVWVKTGNTSISLNSIISPDGTQNASRISGLDGSGSNDFRYFPSGFNSANKTLTFSAYLKGSGTLRMQMSNGVDQGPSQTVTLTNNWKRHSLTATFNSTTSSGFHINFDDLDGATATSYDLYGVQLEEQSYSTSLINTSGTSVTRLADVCNNSGSAQDFNNEGVLYAEIAALADDLSYRAISISDGTSNNAIVIRYRNTSNAINILIWEGAVIVNSLIYVDDITEFNKVAVKYKNGDIAVWLNGVEEISSTATLTLDGINTLQFDQFSSGLPFYGKVRNLQVFTEALSDEELQQLTS